MPTLTRPLELRAQPSLLKRTIRVLVISTITLFTGALIFGIIVVAVTD